MDKQECNLKSKMGAWFLKKHPELLVEFMEDYKKGKKQTSINHTVYMILKCVQELLGEYIEPIKKPKYREKIPYTEEELIRKIELLPEIDLGQQMTVCMILIQAAGLEIGELRELKRKDLHLNGETYIDYKGQRGRGPIIHRIGPYTTQKIKKYLSICPTQLGKTDYVFYDLHGGWDYRKKLQSNQSIWRRMKKAEERLKDMEEGADLSNHTLKKCYKARRTI